MRQWIVSNNGTMDTFERVDYRPTPTSSRTPAEELDSMSYSQALDYLAAEYPTIKGSARGGSLGKGIIWGYKEGTE